MKKLILIPALLAVLLFTSCGFKRGLGLINNQLLIRDWYGELCVEASLGYSSSNTFHSSSYSFETIYVEQTDSGYYHTFIDLGLAVYLQVFSNKFINLSTGIAYTNQIRIENTEYGIYSHEYMYEYYQHNKDLTITYAKDHSLAIVFPDLEINTPFLDGLKFVLKADLLRLNVHFQGGYFYYESTERNDTVDGEYETWSSGEITLPGNIDNIYLSSSYLNLGNITLGLIYYFK